MASNLISEGSDLLLLVPSLAGLVGGLVLPLLGAVPDGAIMLFSGLGEIEKAQETLSVGVGALAGSTIMLLTVPWALSVYYGRVDFSGEDMMPNYKKTPKLTYDGACSGLSYTGVVFASEVHQSAKLMMMTTLPYFLIQVPAFFLTGDRQAVADGEKYWSLAGFVICVIFFVYYMYTQLKSSNEGADKLKRIALTKEAMKKGALSLSGALASQVTKIEKEHSGSGLNGVEIESECLMPTHGSYDKPNREVSEYLKDVLGEVFKTYDLDGNGRLELSEFSTFLSDFHENIEISHVDEVFAAYDEDSSGEIDFDEFIAACYTIIKQATTTGSENPNYGRQLSDTITSQIGETMLGEDGDNDEEQEEVPEDFFDLSPDEQQSAIKRRAFTMLTIGTALVLIFSDPMVDVLSETANRIGIPSFYVSFMLAPLASNASEVIASTYYAQKKTSKSITISLTALEGAASMNNTFCLSIFMALIYFRGLAWQYSAETIAIILVQFGMGAWALRNKMSALTAMIVLALFPLSMLFVALLEYLGMD
jgi:Ca2+/Na+ antiporter